MNTKQRIVEFSADRLRDKGFDGFSYLDISKELGITKASVHHHFPKKEDLGLALCEWTHDWLQQGLQHFDLRASSQWNKLERYLSAALKHALSEQRICPISAFYNDLSKLPESITIKIKKLDDMELAWVTKVIEDGIARGEFIDLEDRQAMAALFIFSCKGALYYARLHGEDLFHQTMKQYENLIRK